MSFVIFLAIICSLLDLNFGGKLTEWVNATAQYPTAVYPVKSHGDACIYDASRERIYCLGQQSNIPTPRRLYEFDHTFSFGVVSTLVNSYKFPHTIALIDSEIYFVNNLNATMYKYSLITNTETTVVDCPRDGSGAKFARYRIIGDGVDTIYLLGADNTTFWAYDTTQGVNGTWEVVALMNSGHDNGMIEYYNGSVYIFGGSTTNTSKIEYIDLTVINPSFTVSDDADDFPDNLGYMGSALVPNDGRIYLTGGNQGAKGNTRTATYLYDTTQDTLKELSVDYPISADGMACAFADFDNRIFCMTANTAISTNNDYVFYSNDLIDSGLGYKNGVAIVTLLVIGILYLF